MKKIRFSIVVFLLFFCTGGALRAAELAVLPYLIETSANEAPKNIDQEYVLLLGLAISITRGLSLYEKGQLERDMSSLGLSSSSSITQDDLQLLAKRRMIEYIATGKIFKTSKGYSAHSILYSSSSKQVIAKSNVSAVSLFSLAQQDAAQLFNNTPAKRAQNVAAVHSVLLLDTSYAMNYEWTSLISALKTHYETVFRDFSGARLSVITFNTNDKVKMKSFATSGALGIYLDSIRLRGKNDDNSIRGALRFITENIRFSRSSLKYALFVTNSNIKNHSYLVRFGNHAAAKKISVYTIGCANINAYNISALRSLGQKSHGGYFAPVYHQSFYDKKADIFNLYMKEGRLYWSEKKSLTWDSHFKPKDYRQVFDFSQSVTPYTLESYFKDGLKRVVIKKDPLEVNFEALFSQSTQLFSVKTGHAGVKRKIARVMLTGTQGSVWSDINDYEVLRKFQNIKQTGAYTYIGVTLQQESGSVYGYGINPNSYILSLAHEMIPDSVKLELHTLMSSPRKYSEYGFFDPPIWFINVKVEQIVIYNKENDIRS